MPAAATAAGTISRSRAGARTRPATTGGASATCAMKRAASSGRARTSRRSRARSATRRSSRRRAPSSAAATARALEVTSYAEVVLAPAAADALHPAFSNLFVQTEIVRERQAILCTRRPRSAAERAPWMFQLMSVHDAAGGELSYETDRARFIGRGASAASPRAMREPLSGSEGAVLDPCVAIRSRITLEPQCSATIDMVCGIGATREACLALAAKYRDRHLADRVFDLASTH